MEDGGLTGRGGASVDERRGRPTTGGGGGGWYQGGWGRRTPQKANEHLRTAYGLNVVLM